MKFIDKYEACDLYEIKTYEDYREIIIYGYYYTEGEDYGNGEWRHEEYSGFEVPLEEFINWEEGEYDVFQEGLNHYVEEMTEDEVIMETKDLENIIPLPYKNITMETPDGFYVDKEV